MIISVDSNQVYIDTGNQQFQSELPVLVFIHGAQNDHSVWNWHSQYFAQHGYNVVAVDLPGHGQSKGPALHSIEAMAHWLLAVFDEIGIAKASLTGHSMGSLIALETARIAPERVTRLALIGTAYPMKVADALLTTARENEPAAIALVTKWSHYQTTSETGMHFAENTKRLMQRLSEINPAHLLYTDLSACNNYAQGAEAANVINHRHCPALFLLAQQDRMTPVKASTDLRAAISESRMVEITECGHAMMSEQPEAVLAALVGFFG